MTWNVTDALKPGDKVMISVLADDADEGWSGSVSLPSQRAVSAAPFLMFLAFLSQIYSGHCQGWLPQVVVLCLLLSKFTFAPSTKPITWNLSGVRYPTAGSDSQKPALPMQVALYKPSAAAAAVECT